MFSYKYSLPLQSLTSHFITLYFLSSQYSLNNMTDVEVTPVVEEVPAETAAEAEVVEEAATETAVEEES